MLYVKKLKTIKLLTDHILASVDVKSLFTNNPKVLFTNIISLVRGDRKFIEAYSNIIISIIIVVELFLYVVLIF